MKFFAFFALISMMGTLLLGCSSEVDCTEQRQGDFAIDIQMGKDSECAYEGTVENQSTGEISDMTCDVIDGECSCRGGDDFVVYRVNITNQTSSVTQTTLIEVEPAPSPICVTRDADGPFTPVGGDGGAGGAGSDGK